MRKSLIVLAFVAGCGASSQSQPGGNANASQPGETGMETTVAGGLTGLYQSGSGTRPDQMCILEKKGKAQFGVTLSGRNLRACSGAGTATLSGDRLTLAMAG